MQSADVTLSVDCAVSSYNCIRQSLEHSSRCPKCNFVVDKKDDVFPNFMCMSNRLIMFCVVLHQSVNQV